MKRIMINFSKRSFIILFSLFALLSCHANHEKWFAMSSLKPSFQNLNSAIPYYEAAAKLPWLRVMQTKTILQRGDHDQSLILIRQKLKFNHDLAQNVIDTPVYDVAVENAVKHFQFRVGLNPDGKIGKDTLDELNISPQQRLKQIYLNIDRWEQLSKIVENRYILVNIPDYKLSLIENGKEVLSEKVIIGRVDRKTPEINSVITTLIFNPYWNVPNIIAQKDIIPKILKEPNYLTQMHIRVFDTQESTRKLVDPASIDWKKADAEGFTNFFQQEPGDDNALGLIKFEFKNIHSVYLHDTHSRELFNLHVRNLSSGCIRVENPFDLVSKLIERDTRITEDKVEEIIASGKNTRFVLSNPIPIHITYLTAWIDNQGILQFRKDIYDRDAL